DSELSFAPRCSFGFGHFLFPYHGPASSTNTRRPNSPSSFAITAPPPPAPITIASASFVIHFPHFFPLSVKILGNLDNRIQLLDNDFVASPPGKTQVGDKVVDKVVS